MTHAATTIAISDYRTGDELTRIDVTADRWDAYESAADDWSGAVEGDHFADAGFAHDGTIWAERV